MLFEPERGQGAGGIVGQVGGWSTSENVNLSTAREKCCSLL